MSELARLGLACALTANKDNWTFQVTPVELKTGATEATMGETEVIELHQPADIEPAFTKIFEVVDNIIKEKHKGKVKVAFGIDRRKSLSDDLKEKLNPILEFVQKQIQDNTKPGSSFEDRVDDLATAVRTLFAQQAKPDKDKYDFEARSYDALNDIEQHLVKLKPDNEVQEDLRADIDTYIRTLKTNLIPMDMMMSLGFMSDNPNQARFIALPPIKSPKHQRFERARQNLAANHEGFLDKLIYQLVNAAKYTKPFAMKFFGIDDPSPPYSDVVAGMLYEDEAKEHPEIKGRNFGAVYLPKPDESLPAAAKHH